MRRALFPSPRHIIAGLRTHARPPFALEHLHQRDALHLVSRNPKPARGTAPAAHPTALWRRLDQNGRFDLRGTPQMKRLPEFGFVSGSSSHADRVATIRDVHRKHGRMIDTHTADGMKVALAYREPDVPMFVLEIARPAKFEETIFEALGVKPPRPVHLVGIESLPKHFQVVLPSAEAVKQLIAEHCR